jgi:hypothetical protein
MSLNLTRASGHDPVRAHYDRLDSSYWESVQQIIDQHHLSSKQVLQNYLSFMPRRDLPRLLAHYDMFKEVVELPGSIVELGVYNGNGLFTWAKLLETFCPGDRIRKAIGFDDFRGYHSFGKEDQGAKQFTSSHSHQLTGSSEFIDALLELNTSDNLLRGVERALVIKGDICTTVPHFVENSPGFRISLLYLDANLYEPTKVALKHLFPLVVPGGIVAFNAYGQHPWEGESSALDEFFEDNANITPLKRFPFSTIPSGYFKKRFRS